MTDFREALRSLDTAPATPDPVARVRKRLRRRRTSQAVTTCLAAAALVAGAWVLLPQRDSGTVLPPVTSTNPLHVTEGMAVRGFGHVVEAADGTKLCGEPLVYDLGFGPTDELQCVSRPVPLRGFPSSLLKQVTGGRSGSASFSGTWHDDGVDVTTASPAGPGDQPFLSTGAIMDDTVVPCPAPAGGWPTSIKQEDYPAALAAERRDHPDDVLGSAVLHPAGGQVLGVVTESAEAADRVRAALGADYGKGLCVVVGPATSAQLKAAEAGAPGIYKAQGGDILTGLRIVVSWATLVVNDEVGAELEKQPKGLVIVSSLIGPADYTRPTS